jgi:hypothetical protein
MQRRSNASGDSDAAMANLPKSHAIHWVARRKAQVVQAVRRGWMTLDEACARYRLSFEEFLDWQRAFSSEGVAGLTSSHLVERHRRTAPKTARRAKTRSRRAQRLARG